MFFVVLGPQKLYFSYWCCIMCEHWQNTTAASSSTTNNGMRLVLLISYWQHSCLPSICAHRYTIEQVEIDMMVAKLYSACLWRRGSVVKGVGL